MKSICAGKADLRVDMVQRYLTVKITLLILFRKAKSHFVS